MTTPVGPYAPHQRVTFEGYFGTEAVPFERWSFRLNGDLGSDGQPPLTNLEGAFDAYNQHVRPLVRDVAVLEQIKWASIGQDGRYTEDPVLLHLGTGGLPGSGAAGAAMPPQIALAVSLNTAKRGPRGRGRLFLPAPAAALDAELLMSAPAAQAVAQAMAGFLGALSDTGLIGTPSIVSQYGDRSPITSVRVGRALDTIRSRRRSLVEGYGADVVVP